MGFRSCPRVSLDGIPDFRRIFERDGLSVSGSSGVTAERDRKLKSKRRRIDAAVASKHLIGLVLGLLHRLPGHLAENTQNNSYHANKYLFHNYFPIFRSQLFS